MGHVYSQEYRVLRYFIYRMVTVKSTGIMRYFIWGYGSLVHTEIHTTVNFRISYYRKRQCLHIGAYYRNFWEFRLPPTESARVQMCIHATENFGNSHYRKGPCAQM